MVGTRCAVATCNNTYKKAKKERQILSLHSFPKEESLRKAWVSACGRDDVVNPDSCHICSDHFSPDDLKRDQMLQIWTGIKWRPRLQDGAIPSRNLPNRTHINETSTDSQIDCDTEIEFWFVDEYNASPAPVVDSELSSSSD